MLPPAPPCGADPALVRQWLVTSIRGCGLTVAQLARRSGLSKSSIHKMLDDNYNFSPSALTMAKLASAMEEGPDIEDRVRSLLTKANGPSFGFLPSDAEWGQRENARAALVKEVPALLDEITLLRTRLAEALEPERRKAL